MNGRSWPNCDVRILELSGKEFLLLDWFGALEIESLKVEIGFGSLSAREQRSVFPERAKPIRRKLGVAYGVHDVAVPEIRLDRTGVHAIVGEIEAGGVP